MQKKWYQSELSTRLEDLEALREQAAALGRLRGIITARFHDHPNSFALADLCGRLQKHYMEEFDRQIGMLLDMTMNTDERL